MSKVIAILCSDLHLCQKVPVSRSAEPSWYEAMARSLTELAVLAEFHDAPIICAGDIFDRWNSPPELINFAIQELPKMHAIPGQHDLPLHNLGDMKRSAYWTLVEAGIIKDLSGFGGVPRGVIFAKHNLHVRGFPWGNNVGGEDDPRPDSQGGLHLAVCHEYIWTKGNSYPGAAKAQHAGQLAKRLQGFDAAVFGDNHIGFLLSPPDGCQVLNSGGFMRRTRDQIGYKPSVGLLHSSGTIKRHYLDTTKDLFTKEALESAVVALKGSDSMDQFDQVLKEFEEIADDPLDFEAALKQVCKDPEMELGVRNLIMEVLEHGRQDQGS